MMIKDVLFYFVIILITFLFLGNTEIQIKPFKINIPDWKIAVGIFLIFLGTVFVVYGGETRGKRDLIEKIK